MVSAPGAAGWRSLRGRWPRRRLHGWTWERLPEEVWSLSDDAPQRGREVLARAGAGVRHLTRSIDDDDVRRGGRLVGAGAHPFLVVQRTEGRLLGRHVLSHPL